MLTRQSASSSPASVGNSTTDFLKPGAFIPSTINCYNLLQMDRDGMSWREQESCVNNLLSSRSQKINLNFTRQAFVFYVQTGLILYLSTLLNTPYIYILMSLNKKSKYDS